MRYFVLSDFTSCPSCVCEKGCLQGPEQEDLGISAEIDQEVREAAAATRTVQALPGVMDTQSQATPQDPTQVAAGHVVAAGEEAQEEQKWQSFMAEHFGRALSHLSLTSCGKYNRQTSQCNCDVTVRYAVSSLKVGHFRWALQHLAVVPALLQSSGWTVQ